MTTRYKAIMLIDDDEDDHEIFLTALENIDADVTCTIALNGKEALDILAEDSKRPELIFLDINMPLMSGVQFLRQLKTLERYKDIPVIIYTTTDSPDTKQEMKALGAKAFISKPETFTELEVVLRDLLVQKF